MCLMVGASRLSGYLVMRRLTARGLVRWRRGGLGRWRISATASAVAWFRVEGGKGRLGGDLAADDVQGAGERQPVGVEFCLVGGLGHELADGVVRDEQPVELLDDHVRGAGAQDGGGPALAGFQFAEGDLNRPPLMPVIWKPSLAWGLVPGR